MRHVLILRAIQLPLLASLCVCTAVVSLTAHGLPVSGENALSFELHSSAGHVEFPQPRAVTAEAVDRSAWDLPAGTDVRSDESLPSVDWPSVLAGVGEYLERLNSLAKQWPQSHHEDAPADTYAERSERNSEAASSATSAVTGAQQEADAGESARPDGADAVTTRDEARAPLQLVNVADNGYPVGFLLAGQTVKLQPGESHEVAESPVTVRFDRGGQLGSATKTLTAGRYEFRLGKNGWDLVAEAQ